MIILIHWNQFERCKEKSERIIVGLNMVLGPKCDDRRSGIEIILTYIGSKYAHLQVITCFLYLLKFWLDSNNKTVSCEENIDQFFQQLSDFWICHLMLPPFSRTVRFLTDNFFLNVDFDQKSLEIRLTILQYRFRAIIWL